MQASSGFLRQAQDRLFGSIARKVRGLLRSGWRFWSRV